MHSHDILNAIAVLIGGAIIGGLICYANGMRKQYELAIAALPKRDEKGRFAK